MPLEKTAILKVEGMTCQHCRMSVEKALKAVEGVAAANVDLEAKTATVTYDPAKTGPEEFKKAIARAGYEVLEE